MHLSGPGPWTGAPAEERAGYDDLIARIAQGIVERDLTAPAIVFLESVKPLSFLGNQLLVFLDPLVSLVVSSRDYSRFVAMLEERENLEKLIVTIEEKSAAAEALRAEARRERRRRRPGARGGPGFLARLFRGRGPEGGRKGECIGRQGDN